MPIALLAIVAPLLLSSLGEAQPPKRLVAYYRATDKQNAAYSADNIPYDELTHIIHLAVSVSTKGDGSILVIKGAIEPNLTAMAHAAGAMVLVSPEGSAASFSSIAASSSARINFAQNMADFVMTNNYDGVDIDWEVPAASDQANCTLMMQALRQALPSPQYQLSMAMTDSPGSRGHYDFPALNQIVDFYNVMTYDFHGPWTVHTGHNAPLFANHADPDHAQGIDDVMNTYVNMLGVPKSMINLGLAFYGYEFPAADLWSACNCKAAVLSRNYGNYIKPRIDQNGWASHVDPVSMAPYLTNADPTQPGFITYDDAASTRRKVIYALQVRDLGGVFMWELSEDFDGSSQDLMDAMYAAYYNVVMSMPGSPATSMSGKRLPAGR